MQHTTTARGSLRRRSLVAGAAVLGLAVTMIGTAAPSGAEPLNVTPVTNPDLALACGLDVVLVLDASSSIANNNNTASVKAAATTFLSAFQDTNTRVGIVKFATTAKASVPLTLDTAASLAVDGVHGKAVATYAPFGATNWEAALTTANAELATAPARDVPKLVVFITDGQPNTYTLENGTPSSQLPDGDPLAVDPAITKANALKTTYGAHILVAGIGLTISSDAAAITRLTQISGPDIASPDFDASTTDVLVEPIVASLGAQLRSLAGQVCGGSLTVTQSATSAYSPVVYGNGGAGWNVSSTVTPPGDWSLPVLADPTVSTASVASDTGGTSVFQWKPAVPVTKLPVVKVALKPNYRLTSVTCTRNDIAIVGVTQSSTFAIPGGVAGGDSVACIVKSRWTGPLATLVSIAPTTKTLVYGRTATRLAGIVRSPLKRLANGVVTLWTRAPGITRWTRVGTTRTTATGYYRFVVTPRSNRSYFATFPATTTRYRGASPAVLLKVAPKVSAVLTAKGTSRTVSGTVSPIRASAKVDLRRLVGLTWVTVASATVTKTGAYHFTWTKGAKTFYYRVVTRTGTAYAAGSSTRLRV